MKTIEMQIYVCEFCQRKMFGKGAMSLHERQCKQNPNNKHKCFQFCKHLNKSHAINNGEGQTIFTCELQPELDLYSFKLERFSCHANRIKNMNRMPLKCDLYESLIVELDDNFPRISELDFDYYLSEPEIY